MPTLNIAHRGGAGLWPENTLAAFRNAVAMGADGAELDVHLSKDGEVIVFHDYRLKPEIVRDAGGRYLAKPTPIKDLTLAELRTFDIGRHDRTTPYGSRQPDLKPIDGERIPTLGEVLEICKTSAKPFWLQVELKTSWIDRDIGPDPVVLAEASVAVLKKHGFLHHAIFVGFDWPGLLHVKKISDAQCWFTTLNESWFREGDVPREDEPPAEPALKMFRHWANTGTSPWAGGFDAVNHGGSIRRAIKAAGGDGWFPPYRDATVEAVAEAKSLGLKIGAWTVDDSRDMKILIARGLDALCTDRPDVLAAILKETAT